MHVKRDYSADPDIARIYPLIGVQTKKFVVVNRHLDEAEEAKKARGPSCFWIPPWGHVWAEVAANYAGSDYECIVCGRTKSC